MSGRSTRKGANGEREVMSILRERGYPVERGGTQSFGERPDLYGLDGIHIEVKRRETVNLSAALAQAEADAQKFGDGLPAVFHRANRKPWTVSMPLDAWLQLYAKTACQCGEHCSAAKSGEKRSGYQVPADSNHTERG